MKTVILSGGYGTRIQEETAHKPKPMIEIGGRPMLWHIMSIYAAHGFNEFVIALGYRAETVRSYFLHYAQIHRDLTVRLTDGTVTAVRPPSRFGGLRIEGDAVLEFEEKPQIGEGWINGGFFVLEPGVLDYIPSDDTLWERGPLESLASAGQLRAYRHEGFWQPMDTVRDMRLLESLWSERRAPWKVWK